MVAHGTQFIFEIYFPFNSILFLVQAYMGHIQNNAEVAVRDMLKVIGRQALEKTGRSVLQAIDGMDDGSPIQLSVTINIQDGEAIFDFEGTGHEV